MIIYKNLMNLILERNQEYQTYLQTNSSQRTFELIGEHLYIEYTKVPKNQKFFQDALFLYDGNNLDKLLNFSNETNPSNEYTSFDVWFFKLRVDNLIATYKHLNSLVTCHLKMSACFPQPYLKDGFNQNYYWDFVATVKDILVFMIRTLRPDVVVDSQIKLKKDSDVLKDIAQKMLKRIGFYMGDQTLKC